MSGSLDRALRVLRSFAPEEQGASLEEVAERALLPKSSAHRLLATLASHGLVERDPRTRRYRLGITLFELGTQAANSRGISHATHETLMELAGRTGQTCHLAVLSGLDVVHMDKVDAPAGLYLLTRVGGRVPWHATSVGKVLLAWKKRESRDAWRERPMEAFTRRTITEWEAMEAEWERVRSQGYAVDQEEYQEDLCCIAAPVRDSLGDVVSAVGIGGHRRYFGGEALEPMIKEVVCAAYTLSNQPGC